MRRGYGANAQLAHAGRSVHSAKELMKAHQHPARGIVWFVCDLLNSVAQQESGRHAPKFR